MIFWYAYSLMPEEVEPEAEVFAGTKKRAAAEDSFQPFFDTSIFEWIPLSGQGFAMKMRFFEWN